MGKLKYVAKRVAFADYSFEQLFNLNNDYVANRCGDVNLEDALAHGYTRAQHEDFLKRARYYQYDFVRHDYCPGYPIIVIHCLEDDKLYNGDGQTRKGGIQLALEAGMELPFTTVPVTIYECPTLNDTHEFIRDLNTKRNFRWKGAEIKEHDAKVLGGEVQEVWEEVKDYRDNVLPTPKSGKKRAEYAAEVLFFGCTCSSTRYDGKVFDRSTLRPHYKAYCDAYANVVNHIGDSLVQIGVISKDTVNELVNKQFMSVILESYFKFIEKMCKKYGLSTEEKLIEASDRIVNRWSRATVTPGSFKKAMSIDKAEKEQFVADFLITTITKQLFYKQVSDDDLDDILGSLEDWKTPGYEKREKKRLEKEAKRFKTTGGVNPDELTLGEIRKMSDPDGDKMA